jgi:hypothetical protein
VLGLVWGIVVAVALVVRLRYLLHFAVLEAALEASASGATLKDSARGTAYCPSCEMPLPAGANFCVVCGTSVRAGSKVTRARNRTEDADLPEPTRPSLKPTPAGVAPRDNKTTALVVGVVAAVILAGGVVGQVAATAAADESDQVQPPSESPITIDPEAGTDELGRTPALTLGADDDQGRAPRAAASDKIVEVGDGVLMLVPKGFRIVDQEDGFVQVFGFKGYFFAYLNPRKVTLPKLITNNLTGIQNMGVEELQITQPQSISVSGLKGAATLNFRGLLATQQGGSIPVEGFAYYFIRPDGTGATAFSLYGKGALKPKSKLLTGYNTMLNTFVSTL